MNNYKVAKELLDIKTLLELNDDPLKANQYENAALAVLALDKPIVQFSNLNFLTTEIGNDVVDMLSTGFSPKKEVLEETTPKVLKQLAKIPGIRTKDVIELYKKLEIDSISDIEKALKNGVIRKVFGERYEEQLRRAVFYYRGGAAELSLFYASSYANAVKMALSDIGKIEVVGSVRRGKEVVNNIDFVFSFDSEKLLKEVTASFDTKALTRKGNLITFKDFDGFTLKFYKVPEQFFSAGLQYYTGSKTHNKAIQEIAHGKGYEVSKEGFVMLAVESEEAFYKALSLQYIPPEIREGEEEIDLAANDLLPDIIDLSDIRGDLHTHTTFSDGMSSVFEMYDEANLLDYEYIAITDHSKQLKIARGLSNLTLQKEIDVIDRINSSSLSPRILKGTEAEIGFNGTVDVDSNFIDKLDFVIGGLHQFSQTRFENTERVRKAIESGIIDIVAHPTDRVIFLRNSIEVDINKIFEVASREKVALEINLFPNRMDLSTGLIKEARRSGVKYFSVGTDAHSRGHLNFMKYGVKLLKRAWVKKEEILNTYSIEELKDLLWTRVH
jgi:DNA polymerase (family 10)